MDIGRIAVAAAFVLLGSFLSLIFTRLYDYIWKPFFIDHNMKCLQEEMDHLKAKRDDVQIQVSKAELELKTCTHEVKWWLDKVKSTEDEVNHIEEEILRWRSNYRVVYNYLILWKRYNVGYKVVTKRRELIKIHDKGAFKDVATELPPPAARVLPSTPRVRAMDSNRDQILQYLNEDKVKMIGIWGMGGLGKTTLLKLINNYFTHSRLPSFDHVIFVVASKNLSLEKLQKKIFKGFGLHSERDDDINSRATLLFSFLQERNALFLLDDLWEYIDLIGLGIPLEQSNCKVVFTTRSVYVWQLMKTQRMLEVKCLNKNEAWSLFEEIVGENIIKIDPSIGLIAKEIVEECCGLPLALVTIGKAMSAKETRSEWHDAQNLLYSSRYYEISSIPNEMFSILEFSYLNLQDDRMRECFLTCSMWPEDGLILKDNLIICWMGLGLIDDYHKISEAYDRGHAVIEGLIGACLLEHCVDGNGDYVKMHDVLRDMAFWIASDHGKNKNKWMLRAGVRLHGCKAEDWEGPHRISLMYNNIMSLPERFPRCSNLLVLTLGHNFLQRIPAGLFHCLKSLTYLDLSWTCTKQLPAAVGELVKLEFLNLDHSDIECLPKEVGKLVNLKYLLLGHTSCMALIPWKLISRLSKLKVLDLFCSRGAVEMESQRGFEALEQMDGRLMGLGISIDTISALYRLPIFSTISIMKIQMKKLEGTESLELFSPDVFPIDSLRVLSICRCGSLKMLVVNSLRAPGGIPRPTSLQRLEELDLRCLTLLEKIVWNEVAPKDFLPRLRQVQIVECHKVKDVSWLLQLPNLESLYLLHCKELETVVRDTEDGGGTGTAEAADRVQLPILTFPRLRILRLDVLPTLGRICSTSIHFPALEEIGVYSCPILKKLPFQSSNIPIKLRSISGSVEWWDQLVWQCDSTKLLLQGRYQAFQH